MIKRTLNLALLNVALLALLGTVLLSAPALADQSTSSTASTDINKTDLDKKVRHELVMLPYYSVYDDLSYTVSGDTVTLTGQVIRPTLKSDAETAVKRIPGVVSVVDQIEVLPLSNWDNQVRRAVYLRLFNANSPLFRYGFGVDPSIHIIVDRGRVTLKGFVSNASDKQIASMYVQQIFGVFSVTNDLNVGKLS